MRRRDIQIRRRIIREPNVRVALKSNREIHPFPTIIITSRIFARCLSRLLKRRFETNLTLVHACKLIGRILTQNTGIFSLFLSLSIANATTGPPGWKEKQSTRSQTRWENYTRRKKLRGRPAKKSLAVIEHDDVAEFIHCRSRVPDDSPSLVIMPFTVDRYISAALIYALARRSSPVVVSPFIKVSYAKYPTRCTRARLLCPGDKLERGRARSVSLSLSPGPPLSTGRSAVRCPRARHRSPDQAINL